MAQFQPAFDYIMRFEDSQKSYADVPDNKGRAISGINSLAFPEDFVDIASLPQKSRGQAVASFYLLRFWTPLQLGGLNCQDAANRVLDQAVNGGLPAGAVMLQRAVNACGGKIGVDGQIGNATLDAANALDGERLVAALRATRTGFYQAVLVAHPEDAPYRNVWLARASA